MPYTPDLVHELNTLIRFDLETIRGEARGPTRADLMLALAIAQTLGAHATPSRTASPTRATAENALDAQARLVARLQRLREFLQALAGGRERLLGLQPSWQTLGCVEVTQDDGPVLHCRTQAFITQLHKLGHQKTEFFERQGIKPQRLGLADALAVPNFLEQLVE